METEISDVLWVHVAREGLCFFTHSYAVSSRSKTLVYVDKFWQGGRPSCQPANSFKALTVGRLWTVSVCNLCLHQQYFLLVWEFVTYLLSDFSSVFCIVTETYRPPAAAFAQCLLCCVNGSSSCTADHYLNGNNHGSRWHPWWYVLLLMCTVLAELFITQVSFLDFVLSVVDSAVA